MASAAITHVTDSTFEQEVLKSDTPVLVDFWATWCAPCRAIAPLLDKLADAPGGAVRVCKVDVDVNNQWAQKFGVRGVPTLLLVKDGQVIAQHVGALSSPQLDAFVAKAN